MGRSFSCYSLKGYDPDRFSQENDHFEPFKTHWINMFFGVSAKVLTPDAPVEFLCKYYDKELIKQ